MNVFKKLANPILPIRHKVYRDDDSHRDEEELLLLSSFNISLDLLHKMHQYNHASLWYGGWLADEKAGSKMCDESKHFCTGQGKCVDSCDGCEGFGATSADRICRRLAHQAICDPDAWVDKYEGIFLNQTRCSGLE